MPVFASRGPATDNGVVDRHGSRSRERARPRTRRVLVVVLVVVLAAAATAGCAGRKGRNDDDPGPREYSSSVTGVPLVPATTK